ncbi:saccharopine dehydrogenase NADP-binding domain-containing protein [Pseudonocardia endophytica]|uniref:Saccharopine dehydrogenase-like protein n=1 Tax=Pseudonocardia endophytica TaxID=401976 RepID=A0A4R1HZX4_PSEEN|nr:saccharopine dehydrogenase NADP-binding domain-containing protein [Pseudonocardia endophytica]TCK25719.1 saccharopine dehydrogenase-like protein [Pseudonocardia endophytica]
MSDVVVGILGGYGTVGRATAHHLRTWAGASVRLRIGGRRADAASAFVSAELGGDAEAVGVDLDSPSELDRFADGCAVVVNCAGPSRRAYDRAARAARDAGAGYVDAAGEEPLRDRLADPASGWRGPAVLNAGMFPGLSGLLPRCLYRAERFDRADRLLGYVGGIDRFTPGAAGDYVESLFSGSSEGGVAWRGGVRTPNALRRLTGVELPFFPDAVTAQPGLTSEVDTLVEALHLSDVDWYNVFPGDRVLDVLRRIQGTAPADRDVAAATGELIAAAELDRAGRRSYQLFVYQLEGTIDGGRAVRTLVLRGEDGYGLSGMVTALAAVEVLEGAVPDGAHFAADVLDPDRTWSWVRDSPAVTTCRVVDGPAGEDTDEGEL